LLEILKVEKQDKNLISRILTFLYRDPTLYSYMIHCCYSPLISVEYYVALRNEQIEGLLFKTNELKYPTIYLAGSLTAIETLLDSVHLNNKLIFRSIEDSLMPIVESKFDVRAKYRENLMVCFKETFSPMFMHKPRKLGLEDLECVSKILKKTICETRKLIEMEHQIMYGIINEQGDIVSFASTEVILPEVATIGNVFTAPAYRNRGMAKSVVSAVTQDALERSRLCNLFVRENNMSAVRVYSALGYKPKKITWWLDVGQNDGQWSGVVDQSDIPT